MFPQLNKKIETKQNYIRHRTYELPGMILFLYTADEIPCLQKNLAIVVLLFLRLARCVPLLFLIKICKILQKRIDSIVTI